MKVVLKELQGQLDFQRACQARERAESIVQQRIASAVIEARQGMVQYLEGIIDRYIQRNEEVPDG